MSAADLLDLIEACTAFAIPALFGFCIGRNWPRERENEKVGRAFLKQTKAVHDSLTFCGEHVTVTRTMTVHTPGKPAIKLTLTNAPPDEAS